MALNDKQKRFAEEYLIDLNATAAAKRAGYSEKTAYSMGHELLKKPEIQTYIQERQVQLQESLNITQERVLKEYAKIAFFDIRKAYDTDGSLLPVHELDDETAGAICGIESIEEKAQAGEETIVTGTVRKVKVSDKRKALEDLARHLGMFEADNKQKGSDSIKTPTLKLPDGTEISL